MDNQRRILQKLSEIEEKHNELTTQTLKKHEELSRFTKLLWVATIGLVIVTALAAWYSHDSEEKNTKSNHEEAEMVKRAEFSYEIWKDYKQHSINDTLLKYWYYKDIDIDEALIPDELKKIYHNTSNKRLKDSIAIIPYRNSIKFMLNYFEDLNSLWKRNMIDTLIIRDYFEGALSLLNSKSYVHEFICERRESDFKIKWERDSTLSNISNCLNDPIIEKQDKEILKKDNIYKKKLFFKLSAKVLDGFYIWGDRWKINGILDSNINSVYSKFYDVDKKQVSIKN